MIRWLYFKFLPTDSSFIVFLFKLFFCSLSFSFFCLYFLLLSDLSYSSSTSASSSQLLAIRFRSFENLSGVDMLLSTLLPSRCRSPPSNHICFQIDFHSLSFSLLPPFHRSSLSFSTSGVFGSGAIVALVGEISKARAVKNSKNQAVPAHSSSPLEDPFRTSTQQFPTQKKPPVLFIQISPLWYRGLTAATNALQRHSQPANPSVCLSSDLRRNSTRKVTPRLLLLTTDATRLQSSLPIPF